jgi:hypothetical protein
MSEEVFAGAGPAFDRELPKAGSCVARVWRIFDVGTQPGFKGAAPKPNVIIYFITSHKYTTGDFKGKRMLANQKYILGLGEKSYLRRDTEAIINRPFTEEEEKLVKESKFPLRKTIEGSSCLIQIVHNNGWANIKTVMSLPDGMAGLASDAEADPADDYIPSYVEKLREQSIITPEMQGQATTLPQPEEGDPRKVKLAAISSRWQKIKASLFFDQSALERMYEELRAAEQIPSKEFKLHGWENQIEKGHTTEEIPF